MQKLAIVAFLSCGCALAQFGRGGGDYSTAGSDAQRSSWVRNDAKITRDNMQKPGFALCWKVKVNNEPRQLNSLTPPALLTRYIGYRGFRSLAFVGGSADKVFAFDTDLGRVEWQKPIAAAAAPSGNAGCPGGMTANVTLPVSAAFPGGGMGGRGGGGRGGAAKSGVGEPGEGAVTIREIASRGGQNAFPFPQPDPNAGRRGGRGANAAPGAPPPGGRQRMASYMHAVSSDGMFHSMYVSNGDEPEPPVKFLPPNANAVGLTLTDGAAYAVTTGNCGGVPNALWALDIASKQVSSWQAPTAIAGSDGAAIGPDGTLYVATDGGELAVLEPKTLKVKDIHKSGQGFITSPLLFQYKEQVYAAMATKDGRIYIVDIAKLAAAGYKSAAYTSAPTFTTGALSSWQDPGGTRYILAATPNSIVAMKMTGEASLEPAWTSREIASPLTPLIVDGVVFAASGGQRSTPAVLYALDGVTGKEFWNSGKTITSFAHGSGLSGGGSQIYLGTYDGTLYAFGFPIEH